MSPETVIDEVPNMMLELNDITSSQLAVLDKMLDSYKSGDKETFVGLLKSTLDNFDGMKQLSQEATKTSPELALPDDIMNLSLEDIIPQGFDLEDVPADMLADMFDYDRFAEMAQHLRELHMTNEDTAVTLHKVKRILREEKGTSDFNFGSYDHDSESTFKHFQSRFQTKHGFNPRGFRDIQKMIHKARKREGLKVPRHLKTKFKVRKVTSPRREQRRRHLQQDEDCQPRCSNDDRTCVCNRLRDCANQLKPYDFAVLFAGKGFVGDNGMFNVDANDIQLFDVDGELTAKIDLIRALAAGNTDEECTDLLKQFHSACPPESETCTSANHQMLQLTADQVCDAINADTFLLMEEIGEAYEDHSLIQGEPFLAGGMVDNEVLEWYESQESGESSCGSIDGEIIDTTCRLEWLNDANCPIFSSGGYYTGVNVAYFAGNESPNGKQWMPEECAAECAKNEECEAWFTIGRCVLRTKGIFYAHAGYTTGVKNLNCDGVLNRCKTSCRSIMDAKLQEVETEWRESVTDGTCMYDESKSCVADSDCLIRKCVGYESTICSSSSDCPIVFPGTLSTCSGPVNRFCTSDSQCPGICIGTKCSPGRCIAGYPAVRAECGAEQFPSPCEVVGKAHAILLASMVCVASL